MIVMNSLSLLEQLAELEEKISRMEKVMSELKIECDKDALLELLIACQCKTGRQGKIS